MKYKKIKLSGSEPWSTFENQQYGFKLKYPPTWKAEESVIPFLDFGVKVSTPYHSFLHNPAEYSTIYNIGADIDLDSFTTSLSWRLIMDIQIIQINGIPAKKLEYNHLFSLGKEKPIIFKKFNYFVTIDENLFVFTYEKTFKHILNI